MNRFLGFILAAALILLVAASAGYRSGALEPALFNDGCDELMRALRDEGELERITAEKYPDPPVKFTRAILEDLTASHPTILLDIAIDVSTMVAEKYPMLPYDMVLWSAQDNPQEQCLQIINTKYPGFHRDFFTVLESKKYPGRFFSLRCDIGEMIKNSYPEIGPDVRTEVDRIIHTRYPELPLEIMRINENQKVNPRFEVIRMLCESYPGLFPELMREIRKKDGAALHNALIDALTLMENKYPGILTAFRDDMMAVTCEKYPSMMRDLAETDVTSAWNLSGQIEQKYPTFYGDLAGLFAARYPTLREEIRQSMRMHFPDAPSKIENIIPQEEKGAETGGQGRKWMVRMLLIMGDMKRTQRIL